MTDHEQVIDTETTLTYLDQRQRTTESLTKLISNKIKKYKENHPNHEVKSFYLASTLEAYEDNTPGDVEIRLLITRPMTDAEKKNSLRLKKIREIAREKKITQYQAAQLLNLREAGVV